MKTAHRFVGILVAATCTTVGCNRSDSDANARRAAAEVRDVASRAGDQLADSWLTTKIQAQYFADEDVKARYINVSTRDGMVTLKGRVDSDAARQEALQIARNTDGVKEVHDQLVVGPPNNAAAEQFDSTWITTQVQARYFADAGIDGGDIDVQTHDGVVMLSGRVDDEREKQQAVEIARGVPGVVRVDDRLAVQPRADAIATTGTAPGAAAGARIDDAAVTSRIQAKFFLDPALKARRIEVSTASGVVTLRGEVASDHERAQALLLARTTEGVERVEDALTVDAALRQSTLASAPAPQTPDGPAAGSDDAALTRSVDARLTADAQVKATQIEVTAKDGVVLLTGSAPSAAAKQRALTLARETRGVLQVIDRVVVRRGSRQ